MDVLQPQLGLNFAPNLKAIRCHLIRDVWQRRFRARTRSRLLLIIALAALGPACSSNESSDTNASSEIEGGGSDDSGEAEAPSAGGDVAFCEIVDRSISKRDCDDLKAIEGQVQRGAAAFNVPTPMRRDHAEFVTLVVDRRSPAEVAAIDAAAESMNASVSENAVDTTAMNAEEPMVENAVDVTDNTASATPPPPPPAAHEPTAAEEPPNPGQRPQAAARDDALPTPKQHVDPLKGTTETLTPKVGRYMSAELAGDGFEIKTLTPSSQEIPPGDQARWQWKVTARQSGTHTLTLVTVVEGKVGKNRYPLARTFSVKTVQVQVAWSDRLGHILDAIPDWLQKVTLVLLALAALLAAFWRLKGLATGKRDAREEEDSETEDDGGTADADSSRPNKRGRKGR